MKQARDQLREIVDKVWAYCERSGTQWRTVTLRVKFRQFLADHAKPTGQVFIAARGDLEQLSCALLEPLFPVAKGIRLLGISLSSLAT